MESRQPLDAPDHAGQNGHKQGVATFQTINPIRSHNEKDLAGAQVEQSVYALPQGYGETRIIAMVRDPEWIFAYWEISQKTKDEFETEYGPSSWVNSKPALRIEDLTVGSAGDASFFTEINDWANNWYIKVGKEDSTYRVGIGRFVGGDFKLLAVSNQVRTPRSRPSEVIDLNWGTVEQIQHTIVGSFRPGLSSPEMVEAVSNRLQEYSSSPGISEVSGSPVPEKPGVSEFWLSVDCELILYGRTVPGSSVSVAGQRIPVREDGSFTVRYNLPDGTISLPVEAVSADARHVRVITPIVNRSTH